MRTLINILLGATISTFSIVAVQAQSQGWTMAGPKNIAGRVLAVHVDAKNDQRIYAGTAGGGFWISTNEGRSWSRSTSFNGSVAVSAITQSNDGTIYIGTGEGFNLEGTVPGVVKNNSPYGIKGDGVYKSTDNGLTFVRLTGTENWEEVNSVAYDNANNKLYVATDAGLKVSSDGGVTFANANGVPQQKGACVRVGSDGTVIYSELAATGNVYVSTNGGAFFASVCGTALPKLPNAGSGRISVDIAPTDPNVMYALISKSNGDFAGVYKSINKGQNWRVIFPAGGNQDPMKGWGYYCNAISVSFDTSNRILLGGLTLYSASDWDTTQTLYYTLVQTSGVNFIHSIYCGKNNIAYLGTNTGIIYANLSAGVEKRSNNLSTLQAYTLGVGNDGRIMIGSRDNGTIMVEKPSGTSKAGIDLTSIYSDGADCVFSMINPEALFYTGRYGYCTRQASLNSPAQKPSQWLGGSSADAKTPEGRYFYRNIINKEKDKEYTRWNYSTNSTYNECGLSSRYANPYVSPLAIWESVNDVNSIDSVMFIADKTYAPGDKICVKSNRNGYPIWMEYTGTDTLKRNRDTIYVKDIVTSRLFIGGSGYKINNISMGGAPVFMTTEALDFAKSGIPFVCVFRTADTTEQVMDLVVSKDGDHLFILVKKVVGSLDEYSIYRVSGFDTYRKPVEMDVAAGIKGGSDNIDNDERMLEDHILIENMQSVDILGIALDPQDNNTLVYVTNGFGDRVYAITDALTATGGAATIESKEGMGIPENIAVYSVIVEMSNSDVACIGTEEGVYKTINFTSSSPTWIPYNDGIDAKVPVFKLYQQTTFIPDANAVKYEPDGQGGYKPTYIPFTGVKNYGVIYAATHGLGVFMDSAHWNRIPEIPTIIPNPKNVNLHVFPNPTHANVTVDFTIANTNNVTISLSDIMGRNIYTKSLGYRMIGDHQEKIDCSNLSDGIYFITVNAGYQNQSAKIVIRK